MAGIHSEVIMLKIQHITGITISDGDAAINTEMDGLTTVLHVQASVIPGKPNHIKLAVADKGHFF